MQDAIFWFYVAQLRFRFHLAVNPNLPPSGDPALFASLQHGLGSVLNQAAAQNPEQWIHLIKLARKWDQDQPNDFTSKSTFKGEHHEVVSGMDQLIEVIEMQFMSA